MRLFRFLALAAISVGLSACGSYSSGWWSSGYYGGYGYYGPPAPPIGSYYFPQWREVSDGPDTFDSNGMRKKHSHMEFK